MGLDQGKVPLQGHPSGSNRRFNIFPRVSAEDSRKV